MCVHRFGAYSVYTVYMFANLFTSITFTYRYASRVKLITNDAQKNSENREIARLKQVHNDCIPHLQSLKLTARSRFASQVIAKLKSGEAVVEDDEE